MEKKKKNKNVSLIVSARVCSSHFKEDDFMRKIMYHGSRSTMGPGPSRSRFWVQKFVMPTKSWMHYNFHFVNFLPSCTVEAAEPP